MKRVYGDMVLVTRFKLLMARRRFVDSVRNTVEGKIALVMMAASPFLMKSLLVSSTMRAAEANRETEAGILAVAHVFMAVALVLGVSSRTARSVIVGWRSEPLVLCAGATRGLANVASDTTDSLGVAWVSRPKPSYRAFGSTTVAWRPPLRT